MVLVVAAGGLFAWLDQSGERGVKAKAVAEMARAAAESVETMWDKIDVGTPEHRVPMLGKPCRVVVVPGWPRRIGELPGCEAGLLREFRTADGRTFHYIVPPEREVRWRAWRVRGPRLWVAVGFLNDDSSGSLTESTVVAKRSGPDEPMPAAVRD
jgi:hypothetical protein